MRKVQRPGLSHRWVSSNKESSNRASKRSHKHVQTYWKVPCNKPQCRGCNAKGWGQRKLQRHDLKSEPAASPLEVNAAVSHEPYAESPPGRKKTGGLYSHVIYVLFICLVIKRTTFCNTTHYLTLIFPTEAWPLTTANKGKNRYRCYTLVEKWFFHMW